MLVLTRKLGEAIIIGEDIEIVVLETSDGNVKLGINAPKNVAILRKEIIGQVKSENIDSIEKIQDILKLINRK